MKPHVFELLLLLLGALRILASKAQSIKQTPSLKRHYYDVLSFVTSSPEPSTPPPQKKKKKPKPLNRTLSPSPYQETPKIESPRAEQQLKSNSPKSSQTPNFHRQSQPATLQPQGSRGAGLGVFRQQYMTVLGLLHHYTDTEC